MLYIRDKAKINNIKDEQGNIIVQADNINEQWQAYLKELLNVQAEEQEDSEEEVEDRLER